MPVRGEQIRIVLRYFFALRKWGKVASQVYGRYVRPARDLIEIANGNDGEVCLRIGRLARWAESNKLSWSLETVIKKWYDIPFLKDKEKQPYIENYPAFERGGRWFIRIEGEIKEYAGQEKPTYK